MPVLFSFRAPMFCRAKQRCHLRALTSAVNHYRSTETLSIAVKTTTAAAALPTCYVCVYLHHCRL